MPDTVMTHDTHKSTDLDVGFQSDIGRIKDVAAQETTQAENKVSPVVDNVWETHLIEVYGRTLSLSHPHIEPGTVSMEYGLSPSIVPLQEGITMKPGRAFGQIASYKERGQASTESIIFNAAGGEVEFKPPNLKEVEVTAELAVATIMAEEASGAGKQGPKEDPVPTDKTEISASLAEPIVIEPMKDFRMELNNGTYRKGADGSSPKLTFLRTTLTYKDQPVASPFETESDETGLHLSNGESTVELDAELLAKLGMPVPAGLAKEWLQAEMVLDQKGTQLKLFEQELVYEEEILEEIQDEELLVERLEQETWTGAKAPELSVVLGFAEVKIGEATFYLHMAKEENGKIVSAERGECYHGSFDLKLRDIRIKERGELTGKVESMSPLTNPDVKIQCENVICDQNRGLYTEMATLKRGEQEYTLEYVTFGENEQISALTAWAEINGYPSILYNTVFRSHGEIAYEEAEVRTMLHFGLNKGDKKAKYNEDAQAFFTFHLGQGTVFNDQFSNGTQALKLASHQKHTEQELQIRKKAKQEKQKKKPGEKKKEPTAKEKRITLGDSRTSEKIEQDIFTDDGFIQLEDAQFDFQNDGEESAAIQGTGGFKFLKIPYDIIVSQNKNGPVHLKGVTQEKGDPEDEMDFTISADGKINAEFEDPVELPMLRAGNESESIIKVLTLKDAAIEDSVLTAKSVRIDRGLSLEQDLEDHTESETAQNLFGWGLKGTMANVGGTAELSRDKGIEGSAERKQLGQFEVSNFLGFMDISGDYTAGTFHAGLKKEAEDERNHTKKLFGEKNKHVSDDGMSIPIVGPLSFEFGVSTSLGIGGELSADLARNPSKSFGEEMVTGDAMNLEGTLRVAGSAGVTVSAGLAVGVSALITNLLAMDLKLNADLGAEFETTLTGGTSFEKKNGELKQAENLEIAGGLDVTLGGSLSLTSDVKLLIWKANIFTLELGKKEIKLTPVSGTVTRDKDAKGITEGWNFEKLDLSIDAFGKKAGLSLKDQGEAKQEPLKVTAAKTDAMGKDAMAAWAILEDLKREQTLNGEHIYFMEEAEKTALEAKIQAMTATVQEKLTNYVAALATYESRLEQEEYAAKEAVDAARNEQNAYQQRDEVRNQTLKQTKAGGFDLKKYEQIEERDISSLGLEARELLVAEKGASWKRKAEITAKNAEIKAINAKNLTMKEELEETNKKIRENNKNKRKMAAVDFAIARMLGIYDNAMRYVEDSYDTFAQVQNMKMKAKNKATPEENLYKDRKDMKSYQFIFGEFGDWGRTTDQLKYLTRFGQNQNYFQALSAYAINEAQGRDREGFGLYRKAFRVRNAVGEPVIGNMSGHALLKIILTDTYPKGACDSKGNDRSGQTIGGTPEDKLKALKYLFRGKEAESLDDAFVRSMMGWEKVKTKQESMLDDTDQVYQALFESNVQKATRKGNVDIGQKLQELDQKLEESKENYLKTVQDHLDAQAAVAKVKAEKADCQQKLEQLKGNVAKGVTLEGQAVAGATGAVDFMATEYQEIASGKAMLDAISEHEEAKKVLESKGAGR